MASGRSHHESPVADSFLDELAIRAQLSPYDSSIWEQIQISTWTLCYPICLSVLRNDVDAQEALNDGYFHAWKGIKTWDSTQHFMPWLKKVVAHRAIASYRDRARHAKRLVVLSDVAYESKSDPLERVENRARVASLLDGLDDDRHRVAICLRYFAELSFREIGEALDVPATTASGWVGRAIKRWRTTLTREPQD
jgi:RNA polymerase sigma-70 factor, ECF subfamily